MWRHWGLSAVRLGSIGGVILRGQNGISWSKTCSMASLSTLDRVSPTPMEERPTSQKNRPSLETASMKFIIICRRTFCSLKCIHCYFIKTDSHSSIHILRSVCVTILMGAASVSEHELFA